jgi:hypothetical protein
MKTKLVLSGSFDQFISWCFENGTHPKNRAARCVRKPEDLQGYDPSGAELVKTGTWYLRPGLQEAAAAFAQSHP